MLSRVCGLLVILLAPVAVHAQALSDHVPADAMVYVGWRGVSDLGPGYSQSNLKGLLDDCDVRQFFDKFLPAVMDRVKELNPDAANVLPILATVAKPTWQHPTAFFIANVDLNPGGPPTPHLGIIWEPGDDAKALQDQLDQLLGNVPAPPFPVRVVRTGKLVALMVGYDNPEAVLAGGEGKSLATNPAFQQALSQVMRDPIGAMYIDYQRLLDLVQNVIKMSNNEEAVRNLQKLREALGLQDLKRLIFTSGFDGKEWGTQGFVEAPEPRTGLLAMANGKPVGQDLLNIIPQTATMAGASRFDAERFFSSMRDMLRSMNEDAGRQVNGLLDHVSRASQVDIEKDLLGSLGDEWAYFTDPSAGGYGLASLTVVNRLKDPAKFEQSMTRFEDYVLQEIERQAPHNSPVKVSFYTTTIDGMTIHYLGVPLVAPSWLVHDGNLYVSAFPQVAAAAARRSSAKNGSILQNPAFIALQHRLGQENPASFEFEDLPKTAPQAYGAWLMITRLLGFADVFGVQSPPLMLPGLSKLEAHLSPAGKVSWVDKDGIHVRAIEPFPGSTLVASDPAITAIYAEAVLISVMLPALNKAREQAGRVQSTNNLKQIGLGAIMYAQNHNNRLPKDLGTLAMDEDLPPTVFVDPRLGHTVPPSVLNDRKALANWVNHNSDYVWTGGGKTVGQGQTVIAHEKLSLHPDGVNVLFENGSVAFMPNGEARNLIQSSR